MAEWKETLEPYIKVQETIKTATQNPTTGDELIIAVALVSDAGSATPTIVRGQKEFKELFASQEDITSDYLKSLDSLYPDGNAGEMWANAYRLAGSNTLFAVRALKSNNLNFAKPLTKESAVAQNDYVVKDGELLLKVCGKVESDEIKFVINTTGDNVTTSDLGWGIDINDVGVFGNYVNEFGPQYDFFVNDLKSLVEQLNETSKFFAADYEFYTDTDGKTTHKWTSGNPSEITVVKFNELYISANLLSTEKWNDPAANPGVIHLVVADTTWDTTAEGQNHLIDLNAKATEESFSEYYAINAYNSKKDLKVRIRKFNHNAVQSKSVPSNQKTDLTENTSSQYTVLDEYLAVADENYDFWEFAILDYGLADEVLYFNVGKKPGLGDLTVEELQESMKNIILVLPDDLNDLDLEYYIPTPAQSSTPAAQPAENDNEEQGEPQEQQNSGAQESNDDPEPVYDSQIGPVNVKIDTEKSSIIKVTTGDLQRAMDLITEDEVYTVEGMSDLGCNDIVYTNYIANLAIGDNYFLPISTVNSTNYMSIGNFATKINGDSEKLYMSAPWDIDTGTLGFRFYACPSVLYWEAVARNRKNNNEFASVLGEETGLVPYQRPVTEFNAKTRRLLLTRKVNTVLWDSVISNWCMNDCYTKQSINTIENEDGNARLVIHISKNIPNLLRQFIGKKVTEKLCADVEGVINNWFKRYILPLGTTVEAWNVVCNYDAVLARQNKIKVVVQTRLPRTLKYIDVYHDIYDTGMEFEAVE